MRLLNLENFCVMSSGGCGNAMCTFLIYSLSLGVLISGMVNCFSDATFDVEHRSSQYVLLLLSVERM